MGKKNRNKRKNNAAAKRVLPLGNAGPRLGDWLETHSVASVEEVNEALLLAAYGLALAPCTPKRGPNPLNCEENVNCLYGLGEGRGPLYPSKDDEGKSNVPADIRKNVNTTFVGLKNLGATCYMNSFMQSLYANKKFRSSLYQWKCDENPEESVCYQLQFLFSEMQMGMKRFISPDKITNLLNIRTGLQQDAQEFCKLFLSYIEERFAKSSNENVSKLIESEFGGAIEYETQCKGCGTASKNSNLFLEIPLVVKEKGTIDACLNDVVSSEELTGDNQYFCSKCDQKCDATRAAKIAKVPPVLNLQLLRFEFDLKSGRRRKVNDPVTFPFKLDVAPFVSTANSLTAESYQYELTAVLLHLGESATGGHYVAHIRNESGQWFRFDDQRVTEIGKSKVGVESGQAPSGDPLVAVSSNAYMLIYTLSQRPAVPPEDLTPPREIRDIIEANNFIIKEELAKTEAERAVRRKTADEKRIRCEALTAVISPKNDEVEYNWIPTECLRNFYYGEDELDLNLGPITCKHGKANPRTVSTMKAISKEAWAMLSQWFPVKGSELTQESLCSECLVDMCSERKAQIEAEFLKKTMIYELDQNQHVKPDPNYFASKAWLFEWRKKNPVLKENINYDITCEHENLNLDESNRLRISVKLWDYLYELYPNSIIVPGTSTNCSECQGIRLKNGEEAMAKKRAFNEERMAYEEVFKKQRSMGPSEMFPGTHFAIRPQWAQFWKQYISNNTLEAPDPIDTTYFIGEDGGLQFDPDEDPTEFYWMSESDWKGLSEKYGVQGPTLKFMVEAGGKGQKSKWKSEPPLSQAAVAKRKEKEAESKREFQDEIVYCDIRTSPKSAHFKTRGKVKVMTSANTSIATLKLQIFQVTDLPPGLLKILFNSNVMEDPKTLRDFGVVVGDTITVEVQDSGDSTLPEFEDYTLFDEKGGLEFGFKGTNLHGSASSDSIPLSTSKSSNPNPNPSPLSISGESPNPKGPFVSVIETRVGLPSDLKDPIIESRKPTPPTPSKPQAQSGPWDCPTCTFHNPKNASTCEMCGGTRPSPLSTPSSPSKPLPYWACSACTYHNPDLKAKACSVCTSPRT